MDRTRSRHRRERGTFRFVEVVPGPRLAVLDGLATASGAFLGGLVVALFALMGVVVGGGELLGGMRFELEELGRGVLGWWALLLALAAALFVPLRAASTSLLARDLVDTGRPRTQVPPRAVRERVARSSPPGAVTGLLWTTLGVAVLGGGGIGAAMLASDDGHGPAVLLAGVVLAAASGLGLVATRGWRERWEVTQRRVRTTWGGNEERAAEAAERRVRSMLGPEPVTTEARARERVGARRRRVASAVVGIGGAVGFVMFMAGLLVRQPGKRAPRRYYGPAGETAIDVLVGVGGALVAAALLALVLWLAATVVRAAHHERRVRAALRVEPPTRTLPDAVVLDVAHAQHSAAGRAAIGWIALLGLVSPVAVAAVSGSIPVLWSAGAVRAAAVAGVLSGLVAVGYVVADVRRSAVLRAQVRSRWAPGDGSPT
ncbi:hypothetical protein [Cellulosimicrobium sp. Marseille-Q4280]|uniref:hypothetical protein n=1 Tax=Cellulosimicrobium sp. Marseille-Q4280 TaxID=2937992 RepID=UPI00203AD05C|nr:hypothetical protein [Cellulosimicrobium sp. Marseille-Q4280]